MVPSRYGVVAQLQGNQHVPSTLDCVESVGNLLNATDILLSISHHSGIATCDGLLPSSDHSKALRVEHVTYALFNIFHRYFMNQDQSLSRSTVIILLLTVAAFHMLLMFPGKPTDFTVAQFLWLPLELPAVLVVLLLLRGLAFNAARVLLIAALATLVLLRAADITSRIAFGRAFSPLAEWHLISQGWSVAAKTIGKGEAVAFLVFGLLTIVLVSIALYRGFGHLHKLPKSVRLKTLITASVITVAATIGLGSQQFTESKLPIKAVGAQELGTRIAHAHRSVLDQQEFAIALDDDPLTGDAAPTFKALEGLDVIVLFVESYGRSFVDDPRFAPIAAKRFAEVDDRLSNAGLHVRSGWVDSPIRGGRSWLAQATLSSGVSLTNHARFDRLITSERVPLFSLFRNAGWQNTVLLPVAKAPWVEGAWYDVDQFFDSAGMQYQGKGFGYVTMPDQYILSAFERLVRQPAKKPLVGHIGLLGSHAPWTPLAKTVPWDDVGDGSIFDGTQRFGEPLDWSNGEQARDMYGQSVDRTLATVGEYLERHGNDALFIVVGDHQPASIIAGWAPNAHVPIHFVSDNPAVLDRLPVPLFSTGMVPSETEDALPMAGMRELLSTIYEQPLATPETLTLQ